MERRGDHPVLDDGLGVRASLDPTIAAMLAKLDGRQPLGEICADLARVEGPTRPAVE